MSEPMILLDPTGPVTVRMPDGATRLYPPGVWIDGQWSATTLGSLPAAARDLAVEHWTDERVSTYRDAARPVAPSEADLRRVQFPNLEPDRFWFAVRLGGYEQQLRDWVASLNDPESPDYDPLAWAVASAKLDFAKHFERDHPLVAAAADALGITELELDQLWQVAAA